MATPPYLILLARGDERQLHLVASARLDDGQVRLEVHDALQEAWLRAFFAGPHARPTPRLVRPAFPRPGRAEASAGPAGALPDLYVFTLQRGGLPLPSAGIYPLRDAIQVYTDTYDDRDDGGEAGTEDAERLVQPWEPGILPVLIQELRGRGPGWVMLAAPAAEIWRFFHPFFSYYPALLLPQVQDLLPPPEERTAPA